MRVFAGGKRRQQSARAAAFGVCLLAVAALRGFSLAAQQSETAREALTRGHYQIAEQVARRDIEAIPVDRRESLEGARAMAMLAEAAVADGGAARDEVLSFAMRSLAIRQRQLDPGNVEIADAWDVLGLVHTGRGDDAKAIAAHRSALDLLSGEGHEARRATVLQHIAVPLINLEQFDEARAALDRALSIRDLDRADDRIGVADVEELLATMFRARGEYQEARQHLLIAMSLRRELTPDHPAIAALLHLAGDIAFLTGDPKAALTSYREALSRGSELGANHPLNSLYSRKLALAESTFGNAPRALELREEALRIAEASLAPCHLDRLGAMNDLAASYLERADYRQARSLYSRALDGHTRCQGESHSLTATAQYNLAVVANATGDWADAERFLNSAIHTWSSTPGGQPFVPRAQDLLAEVLQHRGFPRRALALHQQVLATRKKLLGPNDPGVARTLTLMAFDARRLGNNELALRYANESEQIFASVLGGNETAPLASILALHAEIERAQGNRVAAEQYFARAVDIRVRQFGEHHPTAATARAGLATLDVEVGNTERAVSRALQVEDAGRDLLRFTIRELPERQALAYAESRPTGLGIALSAASARPAIDSTQIFDAAIRSRGAVLDELAARARAIDAADPVTLPVQREMAAARQRYATLALRALQNAGSVPPERLEDARVEKERAEQALAERSADAREELARSGAGLGQVRAALPAGSALVSFVKYERTRPPAKPNAPPLPLLSSYAAFVMTGGASGQLTFVPLGSAARIEPLILAWRNAVLSGAGTVDAAAADAHYRGAALPLRTAVWDPIAGHLAGATRVYIVPDGQVNLVNFASLPAAARGYLAESTLTIHYLSTERDLLVDAPRSGSMTALVVGRPSFGASARRGVGTTGTRDGCLGDGGWQFGDLPGTGQEATDISRVWSRAGGEVTLLTGAGATKTAFRQAASTRRVVHLATHGFFLGAGCAPAATRTRSVGGLVSAADVPAVKSSSTDNPLLLSGLALAGANRRVATNADQDNGILTAEEIAGLDLRGTEWAVLSACDTGLGEIRSGEGVFGLRRAFQIAGARTVIMSLWSVDDASTRAWMRALYEGRLLRKLDTADAVKQASLSVLKQRRAAGQSTHPFYWAAFVAAGDWR